MKCKKSNGTYTTATWRIFYPRCGKVNLTCNPLAGAYVAAVTVCKQSLF